MQHIMGGLFSAACRMASIALESLIPGRCLECGRLYRISKPEPENPAPDDEPLNDFTRAFLCPSCAKSIMRVQSPLCTICGRPFETPDGPDHVCGQCLEKPFGFDSARSAGRYEGALRTLIHQFKYHYCVQLGEPLGRMLEECFQLYWEPRQIDLLIPVPLHPRRLRQRGFNQAFQLMSSWGAAQASLELVRRTKHTIPQTGLNRRERQKNMKKAFLVTSSEAVKDRRILLVDDVFTTGATVDACARCLKDSGAAEVHVLTLARSV